MYKYKVLRITRRQILDSSKLQEFEDDNFKFDENGRKLSKQVENTVEKGRAISLFPTVFSKGLFLGASKGVIVWEWVKSQGPYSPTVFENILSFVHQRFPYQEAFERNKTFDWLNIQFSLSEVVLPNLQNLEEICKDQQLVGEYGPRVFSYAEYREYVYSVAVYQNYLTRLGKLSFPPTELDIFDIRQHYVRILFIFQRLIC